MNLYKPRFPFHTRRHRGKGIQAAFICRRRPPRLHLYLGQNSLNSGGKPVEYRKYAENSESVKDAVNGGLV